MATLSLQDQQQTVRATLVKGFSFISSAASTAGGFAHGRIIRQFRLTSHSSRHVLPAFDHLSFLEFADSRHLNPGATGSIAHSLLHPLCAPRKATMASMHS
jgi:hypothetical protein